MPLPPLPDPSSRVQRLAGLSRAVPLTAFLFSSLLVFNAAQTASLAVRPISRATFRKFNRWVANTWWGWCVTGSKTIYNTNIVVTGDSIPHGENALVFANHQQMPDITFLMDYARTKDRLGDLKWFAKEIIKYVPGVGWGMWFLDCPFLKRNWNDDRRSILETFARLRDDRVPMWLVTFPEGTRLTASKIEKSRRYATEHGLHALDHVQLPRTKGFVASIVGLRGHITAVYDITIGYERGVPTLWQFIQGYARRAHLHVQRYPIETLPQDDDGLATWLTDRFVEKDRLLNEFYRTGHFGA